MILLHTYGERDNFLKDKTRIGFYSKGSEDNQFDIWTAELYKDNKDNFYLFLTADSDEQWGVINFEAD